MTRPKTRIIKVLPALAALKHNVRYTIVRGNEEGVFSMHERHGISSLHFTHKLTGPAEFHLEVECQPIVSDLDLDGKPLHLAPYTIRLRILVEWYASEASWFDFSCYFFCFVCFSQVLFCVKLGQNCVILGHNLKINYTVYLKLYVLPIILLLLLFGCKWSGVVVCKFAMCKFVCILDCSRMLFTCHWNYCL